MVLLLIHLPYTINMKYFASVNCLVVYQLHNYGVHDFRFFQLSGRDNQGRQPLWLRVGSLLAPLALRLGLGRDYVVPATAFTKSRERANDLNGLAVERFANWLAGQRAATKPSLARYETVVGSAAFGVLEALAAPDPDARGPTGLRGARAGRTYRSEPVTAKQVFEAVASGSFAQFVPTPALIALRFQNAGIEVLQWKSAA